MSGPKRLSVFVSVLWIVVSVIIGAASNESLVLSALIGSLPVMLIWGIWWVRQGFKQSATTARGNRPSRYEDVPVAWATTVEDDSIVLSGERRESLARASQSPQLPKTNYLVRLWRGEVRLAVTFWFWGFFVFLVIRVVDAVLSLDPLTLYEHIKWYWMFSGASLAYAIFIWTAIWRSAGNSSAKTGPGLARAWVVLGILGTLVMLGNVYFEFTRTTYSEADVRMMARDINKSLPKKIDDLTILESVAGKKMELEFRYTARIAAGVFDAEAIKNSATAPLCNNRDVVRGFNGGVSYRYKYYGEAGNYLGGFVISAASCE